MVILSIDNLVNLSFCLLDILSISHFVYWPFCLLAILSIAHFVNWSFCQLVILPFCHFLIVYDVKMSFHEWAKGDLLNWPFCQFVHWSFWKLVISLIRYQHSFLLNLYHRLCVAKAMFCTINAGLGYTWSLYYKTFYDSNFCHIIICLNVC